MIYWHSWHRMAQTRNTNKRVCKSRNWQFTLNNYTQKDIGTLTQGNFQYIFQEEKGQSGTPHLQGMLSSNNAVSFNTIKKLIPTAHIEVARNKLALINYCQKGETRCGQIYCNVPSWLGNIGIEEPIIMWKDMTWEQKEIELLEDDKKWQDENKDQYDKFWNKTLIGPFLDH